MATETTERIGWPYGGMAFRDTEDRRYWIAYDSDYRWRAVTDDFGFLVCVSNITNLRGY